MNIETINAIPLCKIFDKLKLSPVQENDLQTLYPSPFSLNETHTIAVHHDTNSWFDNTIKTGGGPLELILEWLRYHELRCMIPDAENWFRFNIGYPSMLDGINVPDNNAPEIAYAYKMPILNASLRNYIVAKKIPMGLARKHLRQLGLTNTETGEEFEALGLKTEENGWWVHSPHIDTFIKNMSVSVVPGKKYAFHTVHVFENIFDYMAAKLQFNDGNPFDDECIILNSYVCLDNAAAYIRGFGYRKLHTWFDDSDNGKRATKNFALLCNMENDLHHELIPLLTQD